MPRTARVAPKGNVYHILTRGNNRQAILNEEDDHRRYFDVLRQYKQRYRFELYHYVLMKNHVHLVLEPTEEGGSLTDIMKGINQVYGTYFKRKNGRTGHFWENRYKSILVSKDDYMMACGSYVELNPVRAGMVEEPGEYPWSSYRVYGNGASDGLVDEHSIYDGLGREIGERRKKYREFVLQMMKEKEGMRGEMDGRMVYGNKRFTEEAMVEHYRGRKETQRTASRPAEELIGPSQLTRTRPRKSHDDTRKAEFPT